MLGAVRCVLHRAIAADAKLLSVSVSREAGRWVASVLIERTVGAPPDRSGERVVGIDLGVSQPVVLSTGEVYALPRTSEGDADHLARLQQRVASKELGSRNRGKAVQRLAAFKAAYARARRDAMDKVTTNIAKNHGVVAMEDLRVRHMTASARGTLEEPGTNVAAKAGLNRSILDVAPGALCVRLGYKLAASGGVLLLVPSAHTSQRCNVCGHI
jgi:putative transposase